MPYQGRAAQQLPALFIRCVPHTLARSTGSCYTANKEKAAATAAKKGGISRASQPFTLCRRQQRDITAQSSSSPRRALPAARHTPQAHKEVPRERYQTSPLFVFTVLAESVGLSAGQCHDQLCPHDLGISADGQCHSRLAHGFLHLSALGGGRSFLRRLYRQPPQAVHHAVVRRFGGPVLAGCRPAVGNGHTADTAHLPGKCRHRADERLSVARSNGGYRHPGSRRCAHQSPPEPAACPL